MNRDKVKIIKFRADEIELINRYVKKMDFKFADFVRRTIMDKIKRNKKELKEDE